MIPARSPSSGQCWQSRFVWITLKLGLTVAKAHWWGAPTGQDTTASKVRQLPTVYVLHFCQIRIHGPTSTGWTSTEACGSAPRSSSWSSRRSIRPCRVASSPRVGPGLVTTATSARSTPKMPEPRACVQDSIVTRLVADNRTIHKAFIWRESALLHTYVYFLFVAYRGRNKTKPTFTAAGIRSPRRRKH